MTAINIVIFPKQEYDEKITRRNTYDPATGTLL